MLISKVLTWYQEEWSQIAERNQYTESHENEHVSGQDGCINEHELCIFSRGPSSLAQKSSNSQQAENQNTKVS